MLNKIELKSEVQQDPRDPDFVADPYSRYAKWHTQYPCVYWQEYNLWCLFRYSSVNRALRDRRFARLPPVGIDVAPVQAHMRDFAAAEASSLLCLEPPEHTRLRKLVNRAFVSRQIGRMEPFIHSLAHRCVDSIEAHGQSELMQHYATDIPLVVITKLLGVPEEAGPQLVEWSRAMTRVYTRVQTQAEEVTANQAAADFRVFLDDVIKNKRKNPRDDLLSHMLALKHADKPITDQEIISVCILLLNAGHEATVSLLGNAVYTLLEQYPVSDRASLLTLLKDNDSANSVVEECFRFASPLHLFTRYAQEELKLENGVTIAKGEEIGLLLAAANRCPKQFDQPDAFLPGRADAAHLSLGAGIHYCVGAQLSKLEIRVALQVLFERLPHIQLASKPFYQDRFHFHRLERLDICW